MSKHETMPNNLVKYGDNQVLHNGLLYFRSSTYKDKIYWRCVNSRSHNCKARFQTTGEKILKPDFTHTHPTHVIPCDKLFLKNIEELLIN